MFDSEKAAARFEARTYVAAGVPGVLYVRKPKVRAYIGFLDLVRKCQVAKDTGGPDAEFDPAGETDAEIVRISVADETGAPVFKTREDVERCLAPAEIVEIATMAHKMIKPTADPTPAP